MKGIIKPREKPSVVVVKSHGHHDGVLDALKLIEERIAEEVKGKNKVLVKPNFVSTYRQLAATHVDAVKAVLDLITRHYSGEIIIGEGPAMSSLRKGLRNFNYFQLQDEYNVRFLDLNEDDYVEVEGYNSKLKPLKLKLSKTVVESDFRISIGVPKTHDTVIVTLSIKNMVVGSLVNGYKSKIHQGYKAINLNIAKLACDVMPHLSIIDGFIGMEGRGPVHGDPVEFRVAAASVYPVSLDAVVSRIMGFNPLDIGYIYHLNKWGVGVANLENIKIIGVPIEKVSRKFKPHPGYYEQLGWK